MVKVNEQIHLHKVGGSLKQARCGRRVSATQIVDATIFEFIYPSLRCRDCAEIYERIKAKGVS